MRALQYFPIFATLAAAAAFCQTPDPAGSAKFDLADVHVSPQTGAQQFMRVTPPRNGRYEIRTATLVDLIRNAWGFDADKILGGPSWLEMQHFDIVAKVPNDTPPDTLKLMLQSLLEERLGLKIHKDTRPLPTYALTPGKKPLIKPADGSGDTGCKLQSSNSAPTDAGGPRLVLNGITLGPGMTVQYECRNMTMEAFAAGMRTMMGANVGTNPVLDRTGLEGKWNFDVKWSLQINVGAAVFGPNPAPPVTSAEAVEKQLGLKLEQVQVATPVLVVDGAIAKPTANPPGTAEALPEIPAPKEFEVVDLKPSAPDSNASGSRTQNGRYTTQGTTIQTLIRQAFANSPGALFSVELVNLPKWAETARYDVTAKVPAGGPSDFFSMGPMVRAMLEDRFKLKTHIEDRPQNAYSLMAAKPKMKKADPASRTSCKFPSPPPGSPRGTQVIACQNITMAQFTDQLRGRGPGLNWPIIDGTALEGGWDFTLTFNNNSLNPGPGRGGEGAPAADVGSAADPDGGFTIFEAVERQLGLKLEMQKRPEPAVVIDHIEENPTDN